MAVGDIIVMSVVFDVAVHPVDIPAKSALRTRVSSIQFLMIYRQQYKR